MNAIILAGGFGNRLKPLTDDLPKPMLNICNQPMIDYCVSQLVFYGIKDIIFSLGYKPEKILELALGYKDIKTGFVVEDLPLGTLGGVKAAAEKLSDIFVVCSGDGLNNINLKAMLKRHLELKTEITIAVKQVENPSLYGVATLKEDGFIKEFVEKPHNIKMPSYVNCGTYIINKPALELVKAESCDFAKDLFPLLLANGKLGFFIHEGYWRDIGDFESYYHANFEMLSGGFFPKIYNFFNDSKSKNETKENNLISKSAKVYGNINECIIGHKSNILPKSALKRCLVLNDAKINGQHEDCILAANGIKIDISSKNSLLKNNSHYSDLFAY